MDSSQNRKPSHDRTRCLTPDPHVDEQTLHRDQSAQSVCCCELLPSRVDTADDDDGDLGQSVKMFSTTADRLQPSFCLRDIRQINTRVQCNCLFKSILIMYDDNHTMNDRQ